MIMADDLTLEDMKMRPELADSESLLTIHQTELGSVRKNIIIAVTTDRLLVRPKRGRTVSENQSDKSETSINLDDIDIMRAVGPPSSKRLEFEIENRGVVELTLNSGFDEIINAIVDQGGFTKTEWGKQSLVQKTLKRLVGLSLGIGGSIIGFVIVLAGLIISLSLVGLPLGILLILIGIILMFGSSLLTPLMSEEEEEWVRDTG
jgi:hypothetical protein